MERFVIEALIAMLLPLKKPRAGKLDIALLFAFHVVRDPTTRNNEGEQAELCTLTASSDECKISSSKPSSTGPSSKKLNKNVESVRSCLPMNKRVEIIHFAAKNPSFGYRKIAKIIIDNQEERGSTNRLPE